MEQHIKIDSGILQTKQYKNIVEKYHPDIKYSPRVRMRESVAMQFCPRSSLICQYRYNREFAHW